MSKATTINFAEMLSATLADSGHLDRFYDEQCYTLAAKDEWLTNMTVVKATSGTSVYPVDDTMVGLIAVLWDDRELYEEKRRALDAYNPQWRDLVGPPTSYVLDTSSYDITVFPRPPRTADDFVPAHDMDPIGRDYPAGSLVILHTEARTDVPEFMEPLLAMQILSREFARESRHHDQTFAEAAAALAQLVKGMI